jgi:hypothetical protein
VNAASIIGEPGARRVSPFLFLLVILSFFVAFTGVSCNTTATKSAFKALGGSSGLSGTEETALNTCIDSLDGVNILTYSGWQLVFGKDPAIAKLPAACAAESSAVTSTDASSANIGSQLLSILGLASVGLALLFALAGLLGIFTGRSRAFVSIIFSAGGGALLVLDQMHVHDILISKIATSSGSNLAGFSPASYFSINFGIGLIVALALLAIAILYNLSALVVGGPSPVTVAELPPAPPPSTLPPEPPPPNLPPEPPPF